jgi:hypothetical protein
MMMSEEEVVTNKAEVAVCQMNLENDVSAVSRAIMSPCQDFALALTAPTVSYGSAGRIEEAQVLTTLAIRKGQIPSKYGILCFGITRCTMQIRLFAPCCTVAESVKYLTNMAESETEKVKTTHKSDQEETGSSTYKLSLGAKGPGGESARSGTRKTSAGSSRETEKDETVRYIRFIGSFSDPAWEIAHPRGDLLESQLVKEALLKVRQPNYDVPLAENDYAKGIPDSRRNIDHGIIYSRTEDIQIEPLEGLSLLQRLIGKPTIAALKIVIAKEFKRTGTKLILRTPMSKWIFHEPDR